MTTTPSAPALTRPLVSMPNSRDAQVSDLLGRVVIALDVTEEDFRAAEQRYNDLGSHLADAGADIYVQGSFMLGTVIAPYGRWGEYDLDLVCRWKAEKASITQARLKERVGELLDDYMTTAYGGDVEMPRECSEGGRCITSVFTWTSCRLSRTLRLRP